jgi:competence protein ComEC
MAAGFQQLSPVAPLSNAVVLPLLPLMVAGGMLIAPLASVPALGTLAALPLAALLRYLEQVAALLARVPAAALPVGHLPAAAGAAYYIGLVGAVIASRTKGTSRRLALAGAVAGPLLITLFEVGTWVHAPSSAIVLDVGNGQAVLLRGPGGAVLVDGGPDPSRLGAGLGAHLPPWDRNLAGLVITGPGLGHVGGLGGLGGEVAQVLVPSGSPPGSAWRSAAQSLEARGARLATLQAGMRVQLAGLRIDVLAPEPTDMQPGQVAIQVVGPSRTFCDFTDLDVDQQTEVASRLSQTCDTALVPQGGISVPALQAAARPGQLVFSEASAARLPRGLPPAAVTRTADEGDVEVPL